MKQPNEDIELLDIVNDPILTDPIASQMIGTLANNYRRACLFSNNVLLGRRWEDDNNPQPGDIVFVIDAFAGRNQTTHELHFAVGHLLEHRNEWASPDEEWLAYHEEGESDQRRIEYDVFYIQYAPTRYCRWVNCVVHKINFEKW